MQHITEYVLARKRSILIKRDIRVISVLTSNFMVISALLRYPCVQCVTSEEASGTEPESEEPPEADYRTCDLFQDGRLS